MRAHKLQLAQDETLCLLHSRVIVRTKNLAAHKSLDVDACVYVLLVSSMSSHKPSQVKTFGTGDANERNILIYA